MDFTENKKNLKKIIEKIEKIGETRDHETQLALLMCLRLINYVLVVMEKAEAVQPKSIIDKELEDYMPVAEPITHEFVGDECVKCHFVLPTDEWRKQWRDVVEDYHRRGNTNDLLDYIECELLPHYIKRSELVKRAEGMMEEVPNLENVSVDFLTPATIIAADSQGYNRALTDFIQPYK